MSIRLYNPTGRNTQAHTLEIGLHRLHFSYETLIAYTGPAGGRRIENYWGPTTGRHFRELDVQNLPVVSQEELAQHVASLFSSAALAA